jgi:fructose/tagatose bisphosphate aldolase
MSLVRVKLEKIKMNIETFINKAIISFIEKSDTEKLTELRKVLNKSLDLVETFLNAKQENSNTSTKGL